MLVRSACLGLLLALAGCSSSDDAAPLAKGPPAAIPGTTVLFDLAADAGSAAGFYASPQPSDLRLDAAGMQSWAGLPNPKARKVVGGLSALAAQRRGHSVLPVAYFHFDAALAARDAGAVVVGSTDAPLLLIDVDPASPERGKTIPTIAGVLSPDDYVPTNLLAVAARPGFVLRSGRRYAFVVRRSLGDASGAPLGVPLALAQLAAGEAPAGANGAAAATLYAPLFETLDQIGVDRATVAAATVFTTGDSMADTLALVTKVRAAYSVTLTDLALAPSSYPNLCEIHAKVAYPQFQKGAPPFDTEGSFEVGTDGLPVHQRDEIAPVVITLPKKPMPAAGYPLETFVHGSGGSSDAMLSPLGDDDKPHPGTGPAHVMADFGIAMAGSAMPVNPERLPGASEIAYVNPNNIPATRDIFRQGIVEQMLFLEALKTLVIPADVLAGCAGPTLPAGAPGFSFDPDKLAGAGQSMGAWYTNIIAPLEPRMKTIVPTGAGGYLTWFITTAGPLQTTINTLTALAGPFLFGAPDLTVLHPIAALVEAALEPADPIVGQPRVAAHPLPGMPARNIFTAVAPGDSYFSTLTYEAVQLAFGNEEAGEVPWQGLPDALALDGRGALLPYPVSNNRTSDDGQKSTGVVVGYQVSGYDPHGIYSHDERVKHQYGCFVSTAFATGTATVVAPAALGAPCE